jgi:predicted metal-dependent phosphotriesterase family hydrolase
MTSVMTVLGPIVPDDLGATASHEHILAASTSNRKDGDTRLSEFDTALEELLAFKKAGGDAMVEVTTIDMGREAGRLAELSAASGVKIIAASGFYKGNYSPGGDTSLETWDYLPASLCKGGVRELARIFIQEVRQGIAGTNVRAGILGEIGTSYQRVLDDEVKVLRAAAWANQETGVPISTHTTLGTMGREQVKILKEEGADLGHVLLSHMDLASDSAYHAELASQGVFLGFDTAGKEKYQTDARRVELIRELVVRGFEEQIVISCDIGRRSQMRRYGGRGYAYLFDKYVPRLEAAGISRTVIHKFLVDNPRRLLAF